MRGASASVHVVLSRLQPIRIRLLLPIAAATAALLGLGVLQTASTVAPANDARRAGILAKLATATATLVHELEREMAETTALRQRGGSAGEELVFAQRARTDSARERYTSATDQARTAGGALPALFDAAQGALDGLSEARTRAVAATSTADTDQLYQGIVTSLLSVSDALPGRLSDAAVATRARAVAALAAAEHLAAEQRELLRLVFGRGSYQAGELVRLARLVGAEEQRLADFDRVADPAERTLFTQTVTGLDVTTAQEMRSAALAAEVNSATLAIDPEAWYVAQSHTMRLLSTVEASVARELETIAAARLEAAVRGGVMIGAGTTAVLIALAAAMVVVLRTSRRLLYLRQEALALANGRLPEAITHVANARDPKAVRQAELAAAENTARLLANGRLDEVGHVAAAFAEVHRQALRQAADQALLRLDISAILVALSRRGQLLVDRQLRLLDNFERAEADPDTLSRLFAIDHLAARMRRNAENLLVVGGGRPGRTFARPEMLLDVIRAAAAEIEEFRRVITVEVPDVAIVAPAVGDLVHLLAELMENATTFAAPETPVTVTARAAADGVLVCIYDKGPGMHPDRLAEANRRLSEPDALTGTMGLLVVGRLAARHGVTVGLHSAAAEGTAAAVRLPASLLVPAATLRSRLAGVRPAPGAGVDAGHEAARLARDPRGGGR